MLMTPEQMQAKAVTAAQNGQTSLAMYWENRAKGAGSGEALTKATQSHIEDEPTPQHGYHSWSPEERAEYDAMYDR